MASLMFIEGSIGAGKSSVLAELEDRGFIVVPEPIHVWTEHLSRVYHDHSWSLAMHFLALTTHCETILQALRAAREHQTVVIVERSFRSVDVFVQCDQNLTGRDDYWRTHEMYKALLDKELAGVPQITAYMRTSPSTCLDRIAKRGRSGEDGIDLGYLERLHRVHDEHFQASETGVNIVDANASLSDVVQTVLSTVTQMM